MSIEHREIELRSNTAMVLEERTGFETGGASAVPRHVRSAARAARGRHAIVPAADGAEAAAKPAGTRALDRRSRPTRCSRASPSIGSGRSFLALESSSRPTTSARRRRRRRILNCSTGWPWNSASPAGT